MAWIGDKEAALIDQLISETTDCDFKEAVERARPKSWLKSVSAFANTKGGTLLFGAGVRNRRRAGGRESGPLA